MILIKNSMNGQYKLFINFINKIDEEAIKDQLNYFKKGYILQLIHFNLEQL